MTNALLISTQFPPYNIGGDATVAHYEALGLLEKGIDVNVLCDDRIYKLLAGHKFAAYKSMSQRANMNIFSIRNRVPVLFSMASGYMLHYNPSATSLFRQILFKKQPDFIHFHTYTFFGSALIDDAKLYGKPVLYTIHDFWPLCPTFNYLTPNSTICAYDSVNNPTKCYFCSLRKKRPIQVRPKAWWLSTFEEKIDYIVVASESIRELFISHGLNGANIRVVPWPLVTSHLDIPNDRVTVFKRKFGLENKRVVLYVGRMNKSKGVHILIRSFKKIYDDKSGVVLLLVGTGPDLHYFKSLSQGSRNIIFAGRLYGEEYAAAFHACDVFVLASIYAEFFSIVAHEAMYVKKPVIVSKVGAMPDFVKDKFNGLLVEPNDVHSLSNALSYLLNDPSLAIKMGLNGKLMVQQYNVQNHVNEIMKLVSSIS